MTIGRPSSVGMVLACSAMGICVAGIGAPNASADDFVDAYSAPSWYYSSMTGTGNTLRQQLHNRIDNHTVFSYDAARTILQHTDSDPNRTGYMILVYDRRAINVARINPNGSIPGWDNARTWNREHTWPKSLGVGNGGPDHSDLHQLRPSTTQVNSDRGSLSFGGAYGSLGGSYGTVSDGGTKWYPGDADAGMIARQQFYMDVRYDGSDSSTEDLRLSGNGQSGQLGDLSRMLQWHYAVVPDEFERRRNDIIYESYQGNRNPFVDRPEYAWSVFVDQRNDSRISIRGGQTNSQGASIRTVDLGRGIVGSQAPASQTFVLDKSGQDGTYYSVDTSGAATSSLQGRYNAFRTGQNDSASLQVGLDVQTQTVGRYTGSVTIDNLDITTQGGTGRGANDANDVISLSYEVLNHSNASFDSDSDVNYLRLDFGTLYEGMFAQSQEFSLHNYGAGSSWVADLDLDQINQSGHGQGFSTDLSLFSGLEAGDGMTHQASLNPLVSGQQSLTYRLSVSDEDINGASAGDDLVLELVADVREVVLGDMNLDGVANSEDLPYFVLGMNRQQDYEQVVQIQANLTGDLDQDGDVDLDDARIAANTFVNDQSKINRKQNFIDLDHALDALDDGLVNGSNNNLFETELATGKTYVPGDSRGDLAKLLEGVVVEGADGAIDASDIDFLMRVVRSLQNQGVESASLLLGDQLVDADANGVIDQADVLFALDLKVLDVPQQFDAEAWVASLGIAVPEPGVMGVGCILLVSVYRRRRGLGSMLR